MSDQLGVKDGSLRVFFVFDNQGSIQHFSLTTPETQMTGFSTGILDIARVQEVYTSMASASRMNLKG